MSGPESDLARAVLGALILKPDILEGSDVSAGDFPAGRFRETFAGISEQWENGRPDKIDAVLLNQKISGEAPAAFISSLINGTVRLDPETFGRRLHELRRQSLRRRAIAEVSRTLHGEEKTGLIDPEAFERLRTMFRRFDELGDSTPETVSCSRLSDIEPKEMSWFWGSRIPFGMLSLLVGDPGNLKSFLATWLCSRSSVGKPLPDNSAPTVSCGSVILTAEDSPSYTIRPRADANGADPSKIYVLENSSFNIGEDLKRVRAQISEDPSIRFLVIDPVNSFLGGADYIKDTAVRDALNPLVRFLDETGIAGLGVMHLNKKIDLGGIYRIGGSIAFAGLARSILAVTLHPEDETKRLLRPLKMNYARQPASLAFSIGDDLRLSFDNEPVEIRSDEPLSQTAGHDGAENSFTVEWLRDRLSDEPVELKALIKDAAEVGISRRTLFYCRKKIGIRNKPSGFGKNKVSYWELPRE